MEETIIWTGKVAHPDPMTTEQERRYIEHLRKLGIPFDCEISNPSISRSGSVSKQVQCQPDGAGE
jgi:hypothetical protein